MENKMVLLTIIVNGGYSEQVMEVAKQKGARGGTIFNAVGSAGVNAEKLYGITINPEKEVLFILITSDTSSILLEAIYDNFGPSTDAQGIAFTMPIDETTSNLTKQYRKQKNH